MTKEAIPVSPEELPEEARQYIAAIMPLQHDQFVQRHFYQVTSLTMMLSNQHRTTFFALEFRTDRWAALVWQDGAGNWGAGTWLQLAHVGADITCPPTDLSLSYFQGAQSHSSIEGALALLKGNKPA